MLEVKNLNISVESNSLEKKIVKNVNFNINQSEIITLIGESGSGKSLTALSILRLLDNACNVKSGKVLFSGENIFLLPEKKMREIRRNEISIIFQEPARSLNPVTKIYDQVKESMYTRNKNNKYYRRKVKSLLLSVGIRHVERVMDSYPHQLSGGMIQRVMIAIAIACKPKLLIADEPTTSLDVTIQNQVLSLLQDLNKKLNMSILFITHNLAVASKISDRILVMKNGKIVEHNTKNKFFKKPKDKYSIKLLESAKYKINKVKNKKISEKNNNALEVKNLKVFFKIKEGNSFFNKRIIKAVNNVSFNINSNTTHAIVGESGSGKSTIARAIMGLDYITSGKIIVLKNNIYNISENELRKFRKNFQMVFQDPYSSLNPRMRIGSIIKEGLLFLKPNLNSCDIDKIIRETLISVGLPLNCLNRYPHEFSGGQRQRIAIARALVLEPKLLICDEPTTSLDVTVQKQILDLLDKIKNEREISYLFISHDIQLVANFSDTISVMKNGKIVENGNTKSILRSPKHIYTKELLKSVPRI